ncbi:sigma-70 family RNA polymerase sigma factor [Ktedonosporobacter rubrisoli]|uniref:Sigma-70 family RNA polymerase sigma factor n=1 Tax=Ktedonosporobacter rubrisoli TaxID=2509675 RepID=A0A4V0YZZ2_KTERU|nr:sigma-70 family RNA polymerase sigma factor [Ktedonosporobacter rubrisoli]QBD81411.1 sigma-70 family RNA polymerase sigma factor [Ktedonosporobacter rubrisoli]
MCDPEACPSAKSESRAIDALLEEYDPFINALVKERIHQYANVIPAGVLDLETDEIVQRVRIKFWHALEEKVISYPRAYLMRIVRNEFIDLTRRRSFLPLPVDQEGEIYCGSALVASSEEMSDPAEVLEKRLGIVKLMQETAKAVLTLPRRQQQAMICALIENVDNLNMLWAAFRACNVDVHFYHWPQEKEAKRLLQSSLSYARLQIACKLKKGARGQSTRVRGAPLTGRAAGRSRERAVPAYLPHG